MNTKAVIIMNILSYLRLSPGIGKINMEVARALVTSTDIIKMPSKCGAVILKNIKTHYSYQMNIEKIMNQITAIKVKVNEMIAHILVYLVGHF